MSFTLEILHDEKCVHIKVSGLINMDLRHEILTCAVNALNEHGYLRLFIDVSDTQFNPNEMMTRAIALVNFMTELDFPQKCRIAFFYLSDEEYRKFFECAAQTAGFDLNYFGSEKAAFEWLKSWSDIPVNKR